MLRAVVVAVACATLAVCANSPAQVAASSNDAYDILEAAGALAQSGHGGAALAAFERILSTPKLSSQLPRDALPQVRYNRAFTLQQLGDLPAALREYEAILVGAPGLDAARVKAAYCARELGDNSRALGHLARLLASPAGRSDPQNHLYYADTLNNLKLFMNASEAYAAGLTALRNALGGRPVTVDARAIQLAVQLMTGRGDALGNAKRHATALGIYLEALALDGTDAALLSSLINCERELCEWRSAAAHERQLLALTQAALAQQQPSPLSPYHALFMDVSDSLRKDIAASWIRPLTAQGRQSGANASVAAAVPQNDTRMQLCYLSRRFYAYPGTQLLLGVLKHHDAARVHVTCFAAGPSDDSIERSRLARECHAFVDISMLAIPAMRAAIVAARCDVLIDYDGLHDFNNMALLATRPARVQASWLGFAATTGSDRNAVLNDRPVDFVLTDRVIAPLERVADMMTESIWLLPGSYQPQDASQLLSRPRPDMGVASVVQRCGAEGQGSDSGDDYHAVRNSIIADVMGSAAQASIDVHEENGASAEAETATDDPVSPSPPLFVFACFNRWSKIDDAMFTAWMNILHRAPHAVLWLLGDARNDTSDAVASNVHATRLRSMAAAAGILPSRLVFAPRVSRAEHLYRHYGVDAMLDTRVYGAHTTTADGLFTGLPGVTLPGRSVAARVGASLLLAAGPAASAGVTSSMLEYEDAAAALASNAVATAYLRVQTHAAVMAAHNVTTPPVSVYRGEAMARAVEARARAALGLWSVCVAGSVDAAFSGDAAVRASCAQRMHIISR